MRRISLLCFLCWQTLIAPAQDAAFTDYRKKAENFSKISDKDIRSDLASFTIGGIVESLDKQPLQQVPPTKLDNRTLTYANNHIVVTIVSSAFDTAHHKFTYEGRYLVKIDGKPYYGNYTKIPQTRFASVTALVDKDTIEIPQSALSDLYNPGFTFRDASGTLRSNDGVFLSADKRRIYIYMLNRDDTGSYEVTWIIQDKKYLRRVIDFGFSQQ